MQEVLAEREFMIAHFYYTREVWPAAIARFKSLIDTYPLYSGADDALYEMGNAYERQADLLRRSKITESAKAGLVKTYDDKAAAAYDQILTRYPEQERAADAAKRLQAMNRPVPKATPEAIAQNKKEMESRGSLSTYGKLMSNFKKGPDVSPASQVGEPTLVDPKQSSAPEIVRSATANVMSALQAATATAVPGTATAPPPNGEAPRSDAPGGGVSTGAEAATGATTTGAATSTGAEIISKPASETGIQELGNDLTPPANNAPDGTAPPLPPTQVNDAPSPAAASGAPAPTNAASSQPAAAPVDTNNESSSKKKKKKHLLVF